MKLVKSVQELKECLAVERLKKRQIGFVPTMGALHLGHLSLVERCVSENDICVVSIFVNPTQFNDLHDLSSYPRTLERDMDLLKTTACAYVFAPSVEEMYPEKDSRVFDFGSITSVMEGAKRPGHFDGVAQIVSKLFWIVEPSNAYFGEKDFQQVAVVRCLVEQLKLNVNIVSCPILREADGLAMSSRNSRLSLEQRQKAPIIAQTLKESVDLRKNKRVEDVIAFVKETLDREPELSVEYYEVVDGNSLQSISSWDETDFPVGCIAIYCGEVRLIDNIKY